jgi:hypothetical protein
MTIVGATLAILILIGLFAPLVVELRRRFWPPPAAPVLGSCDVREHTADGAYVGRCEHATHDGVCPRHGRLSDYPNRDDREVDPAQRSFTRKPPASSLTSPAEGDTIHP